MAPHHLGWRLQPAMFYSVVFNRRHDTGCSRLSFCVSGNSPLQCVVSPRGNKTCYWEPPPVSPELFIPSLVDVRDALMHSLQYSAEVYLWLCWTGEAVKPCKCQTYLNHQYEKAWVNEIWVLIHVIIMDLQCEWLREASLRHQHSGGGREGGSCQDRLNWAWYISQLNPVCSYFFLYF